MNYVTVIHV